MARKEVLDRRRYNAVAEPFAKSQSVKSFSFEETHQSPDFRAGHAVVRLDAGPDALVAVGTTVQVDPRSRLPATISVAATSSGGSAGVRRSSDVIIAPPLPNGIWSRQRGGRAARTISLEPIALVPAADRRRVAGREIPPRVGEIFCEIPVMSRPNPRTVATTRDRAVPERSLRVFVSSTFRDMHGEREYLIKKTFPRLRMLCERRGVAWGEVDLRWGITSEDALQGQVLPICLAEISRSDLLIVLLGERYGWIPGEIAPELIDQYRWLAGCLRDSVTEIEIKHGALRDPNPADRAFFYFRDPHYPDRLPAGCYRPDYLPEDDDSRRKLRDLKQRIRESGLLIREPYANPSELAEKVLSDLTNYLDRHYPEVETPDPLDRELAAHRAFAASRTRDYIVRLGDFDHLDAHADGYGPPLTVIGSSGSGKSALLARWADELPGRHRRAPGGLASRLTRWSARLRSGLWPPLSSSPRLPALAEELVISHYVGASPRSANWSAMLRRIMCELQRRLHLDGEIPDTPIALSTRFAEHLNRAAETARVILIIDGIDQLEDREQALDLDWLPAELPANVRLFLSMSGGRALAEIERRRWPTMEVRPLRSDEGIELIRKSLLRSGKQIHNKSV
jgi:hypothetical protein